MQKFKFKDLLPALILALIRSKSRKKLPPRSENSRSSRKRILLKNSSSPPRSEVN